MKKEEQTDFKVALEIALVVGMNNSTFWQFGLLWDSFELNKYEKMIMRKGMFFFWKRGMCSQFQVNYTS